MTNKRYLHKKTFDQIKNEWERIQTLDARSKYKAIRTIVYDVTLSYEKDKVTVEWLEFYIMIIRNYLKTTAWPNESRRFLSKLTINWLALTKSDKQKIISETTISIDYDCPYITVSDSTYCQANQLRDDSSWLHLINQGKCYIFHTGGDFVGGVKVRVVDCLEPVLTSKEFKHVIESSETVIIHIPTGIIAVADVFSLGYEESALISVAPGNYKICTYTSKKYIEGYYIVLCKTEKETKNDLVDIHTLEYLHNDDEFDQ